MSETAEAITLRWFDEGLNNQNVALVDELMDAEYVLHEATFGDIKGPELKSGLLKEECSMTLRLAQIVIASLACAAASLVMAQTPAPRPDPALKKLSALVGHWTYEGEYKAGPLGPGGKVTGEYNAQMTLGGFFFQAQWTEKGPAGQTRGLDIEAYDPVNKNFVSNWYLSDGSRFSGVCAVSEKTYAIAGKFLLTGKQYEFKDTLILAADLMSVTERGEISADGKTWTPLVENKWTKVQPAPKK